MEMETTVLIIKIVLTISTMGLSVLLGNLIHDEIELSKDIKKAKIK